MFDKILWVVDNSDALVMTTVCFGTLLISRCTDLLFLLLSLFLIIPNRINEFKEKIEMGGTCGTYGLRERCAQGFGGET